MRALAVLAVAVATGSAGGGATAPGELIVFASSRSPELGTHLDVVDTRTGTLRILMRGGQTGTASPDGRRVAYIAWREQGPPGVFVARSDGTGARLLYASDNVQPFTDVTWSPDGSRIAFPYLGPKIGIVPAAGGRPVFVSNVRSASWSADGTRLAVVDDGSAFDIVTIGSGRVRVADGVEAADWSRDGRLAATISSEGVLSVRDLRRRRVVYRGAGRLLAEASAVRFSPDGRRLAVLAERSYARWDLVVVELAGRSRTTVARGLTLGEKPTQPIAWAPTGDEIAVAAGKGVVVADARGRGARPLGVRWPEHHPNGPPVWVGSRIFVFTAVWTNDREIYAADAGTGRAVALTHNTVEDTAPALSPDGRLVAFDRRGAVWVRPLGGGQERRLHSGFDPAWSPDGSALAIAVGGRRIEIVDARTGAVRKLVATGAQPAWSPDGSAIAFERDGDIWAAAPDGSGAHRITSGPTPDRMPAYSPDGRRIAYRAVPQDGVGVFAADAADGANVVRLTSFSGRDPAWSPDGTRVVVDLGGFLAIVPADGSSSERRSPPAFSPSNGLSNEPSWGRG